MELVPNNTLDWTLLQKSFNTLVTEMTNSDVERNKQIAMEINKIAEVISEGLKSIEEKSKKKDSIIEKLKEDLGKLKEETAAQKQPEKDIQISDDEDDVSSFGDEDAPNRLTGLKRYRRRSLSLDLNPNLYSVKKPMYDFSYPEQKISKGSYELPKFKQGDCIIAHLEILKLYLERKFRGENEAYIAVFQSFVKVPQLQNWANCELMCQVGDKQ